MTVTFLVAVNITDLSQLSDTALSIQEDLEYSGHDVDSVHPWARPNNPRAQPAGGFTSLQVPPIQ